jgi:hypothetical protein
MKLCIEHLGFSATISFSVPCRPLDTSAAEHNDPRMHIRDAVADDAPAACQVLRRSIVELCAADHGDDPAILAQWLANKTPEIVA